MRDHFIDWTGSDFSPTSEYKGAKGYSGNNDELEIDVFLYSVNGNAGGFILEFENAPPIAIRDKIDFTFEVVEFYTGLSALTWMGDNWPTSPGELNSTDEKTVHGEVILAIEYPKGYSSPRYKVSLFDKKFVLEEDRASGEVVDEITETPTALPPTATSESAEINEGDDGRVGVSVSKVEIPGDLPEEFGLPDVKEGHNYVSISIIVTKIEGVHLLNIFGFEHEEPILHDNAGQTYTPRYSHLEGIELKDITNLTGSYEVIEGAKVYFVFEIIEGMEPEILDLIYSYQDTWDDNLPQIRGEITIKLQ